MLVNAKSVKIKIKENGLRSNKETVVAFDKKVDELLMTIINKAKELRLKTLNSRDVL